MNRGYRDGGYFDKNSFFLGNTIVQYDNNYVSYFLHRNLLKWESTIDKKMKWRAVKRFEKAKKKGYLIKYSEGEGHFFLDFVGDYKILLGMYLENLKNHVLTHL